MVGFVTFSDHRIKIILNKLQLPNDMSIKEKAGISAGFYCFAPLQLKVAADNICFNVIKYSFTYS